VGKYGRKAEKTAFAMLENGMVDLACTDIHRAEDLPLLEKGLGALWAWDQTAFVQLFSVNPSLVLEGKADLVGVDE
jgi:tyrosine-protein phosphatase YwqE